MSHKLHLKLRFFAAAIQSSSLYNFKSDLSNFSYKVKAVLKKILISLINMLQIILKQEVSLHISSTKKCNIMFMVQGFQANLY